ncbi:MAG: sigma-54 interaction domain-containing protein, partial [Rhodothermales bacterium]
MDRQAVQERFGIVGTSAALRHVIDQARQVAGTDITVLIEGESGVGKELIAHAIHEISPRRHGPLKILNCGAIPEGLIESELFGAEKGAYTGATEKRSGIFEDADGGTIFLDEIGEMPLAAQVRLLRVLETGAFSRIGSSTIRKTDVRVIAATNKNLGREVEAGRFREDLYYRLSTMLIHIPPIRERREDILPIFEGFLHQFSQKYGRSFPRLDERAMQLLQQYRWPGNVREIRNA